MTKLQCNNEQLYITGVVLVVLLLSSSFFFYFNHSDNKSRPATLNLSTETSSGQKQLLQVVKLPIMRC